jgi:hypothetical protein
MMNGARVAVSLVGCDIPTSDSSIIGGKLNVPQCRHVDVTKQLGGPPEPKTRRLDRFSLHGNLYLQ